MRATLTLTTERAPDVVVELVVRTTRAREAMRPPPQPIDPNLTIRLQDERAERFGGA